MLMLRGRLMALGRPYDEGREDGQKREGQAEREGATAKSDLKLLTARRNTHRDETGICNDLSAAANYSPVRIVVLIDDQHSR